MCRLYCGDRRGGKLNGAALMQMINGAVEVVFPTLPRLLFVRFYKRVIPVPPFSFNSLHNASGIIYILNRQRFCFMFLLILCYHLSQGDLVNKAVAIVSPEPAVIGSKPVLIFRLLRGYQYFRCFPRGIEIEVSVRRVVVMRGIHLRCCIGYAVVLMIPCQIGEESVLKAGYFLLLWFCSLQIDQIEAILQPCGINP